MPHGRYIDDDSFRRLLQRAVIFPLVLAIGLAGIFLFQVRGLLQVNRWVDEGDQIISKAEHLQLSLTEMESKVRGYVLFGNVDYNEFNRITREELPAEFADLKIRLSDTPEQLEILKAVEADTALWTASAFTTLKLREEAGSLSRFQPTGKGRPIMARIRTNLRALLKSEIAVRNERFAYARLSTKRAMWIGIGVALLLGFVLAIFSRRALLRLSLSYQGAYAGLEKKSQELVEAENRFRSMADAAPVMIWTTNTEHYCDWLSQGWLSYTGSPLEHHLGSGWSSSIHPDDRPFAVDGFKRATEKLEALAQEFRIQRHDGEYRWFACRATPRLSADGTFLGYVGSCIDIHDSRRAQAALAESEARFRHLADAIPQIVWTARAGNMVLEYINERWFEYTGLQSKEDWNKAVHPDDLEGMLAIFREASASEGIFQCEYRLLRASDRSYRWHLGRAVPIYGPGKILSFWFGTATDIEEQKRSQEKVEKALGMRDEFISVASHELRTPLTSLKLQLQMAMRALQKGGSGLERGLTISLSQVDRLTSLVDKLLDISRIQTGRLELDREEVNLSELVREQLERFQGQFLAAGLKVESEVQENVSARCDRFRLEQVFVNLITNALKYGQNQPIEIRLVKQSEKIVFSVKDHGLGIPPEQHEKIFERFQRAGSAKNVDGIGLGLYIARQVVEAHGGRIYVESDGRTGSCFYTELPA